VLRWVAPFPVAVAADAAWSASSRPVDGVGSARLLADAVVPHLTVALGLAAVFGLAHMLRPRRPGGGHHAFCDAFAAVGALHLGLLALLRQAPLDAQMPGWLSDALSSLPQDRGGLLLASLVVFVVVRLVLGLLFSRGPLRWLVAGPLMPALAGLVVLVWLVGALTQGPLPDTAARRRLAQLDDPPNIIIVLADTLRKDRLGLYDYDRHLTSPAIDAFARRATVYDRAYANSSWTIPSMASLFTGRWMIEHGASAEARVLTDGHPTLAEILGDHGYRTMAVSSNSMMNGMRQGYVTAFDWVQDTSTDPAAATRTRRPERHPLAMTEALRILGGDTTLFFEVDLPENPGDLGVRETTEGALQYADMARGAGDPFFMFVGYMANHMPYQFPADWDPGFRTAPRRAGQEWDPVIRAASVAQYPSLLMFYWRQLLAATGTHEYPPEDYEFLSDLYDSTVKYLDDEFAQLIQGLEGRGLLENTIIIFTSDHGESLGEDTDFGHGRLLASQLIDIPLFIYDPARPATDQRVQRPVQSIDLLPTLLSRVGIDERSVVARPLQGSDLYGDVSRAPVVAELHYNTGRPRWEHAEALALWMHQILSPGAVQQEVRLMSKTEKNLSDADLRARLEDWISLIRSRPALIAEIAGMRGPSLDDPIGPSMPGVTFRDFRDYCFAARRALVTEDWKLVLSSDGQTRILDARTDEIVESPPPGVRAALLEELARWRERVQPFDQPLDFTDAPMIPYLR